MSSSPEGAPHEQLAIDAIARGVAQVEHGPEADDLDYAEAAAFLEAKLRCDLLRAEIETLARREQLEARALRRGMARTDLVLALTVILMVVGEFMREAQQPEVLATLVAILAITCSCAAPARFRRSR